MTPDDIARLIAEDELKESWLSEDTLHILLEAEDQQNTRQYLIGFYQKLATALDALSKDPAFQSIQSLMRTLQARNEWKPIHDRLKTEVDKINAPLETLFGRLDKISTKYTGAEMAKGILQRSAKKAKEKEAETKAASAERIRQKGRKVKARSAGLGMKWKSPYEKMTHRHRAGIKTQKAREKKGKPKVAQPKGGMWSKLKQLLKAESLDIPDDIIAEIAFAIEDDRDLLLERLAQGIDKETLVRVYDDLASDITGLIKSRNMKNVQSIMLREPQNAKLKAVMQAEYTKLMEPLMGLYQRLKGAVAKFGKGIGVEKTTRKKTEADAQKEKEEAEESEAWKKDYARKKAELGEPKRATPGGPRGREPKQALPSAIEQILRYLKPI
jgi:hypothetical protein